MTDTGRGIYDISAVETTTDSLSVSSEPVERKEANGFCTICQEEIRPHDADADDLYELPCSHTFHHTCLLRWLHFNAIKCPNCNAPIDLNQLGDSVWRVSNLAVMTMPSPESLSQGMRAHGWYNVQIQIIPPKRCRIDQVKYIFHPAFNVSKMVMKNAPFDLVVKLCSNNVLVLICIDYHNRASSMQTFVISHVLEKEMCTRLYFDPHFSGSDDTIANPEAYFERLLSQYHRPSSYYLEPPLEPSHRSRRRGFANRLIRKLFQID
ncbi:Ring finger domain [Carpediemonas membranifera]|uniref:Ring finger domain n=1 Tax=Carpediemonas membranifera TaxID=201153 RepID=A0A8J6B7B2_9EUKA|nr:Ring finger domain [Carpediemonas membranifera]|eukprot:KAG9397143.1 Ring finger domain [Carpediemonas membranifera]